MMSLSGFKSISPNPVKVQHKINSHSVNSGAIQGDKHSDRVTFQGAGPSKAEKAADEAEEILLKLISNNSVPQSKKTAALKHYEKAKREAGQSQAIKETVRWMAAVGGAGAGFITTGSPDVATAIGTVLAATGDHLGNAMANLYQSIFHEEWDLSTTYQGDVGWSISPC